MSLPQTTAYAIRAMYHLAHQPPEARSRALDLAAATGISAPYLSKVLARLARAGLIDGVRGHHGGFRLARPATTITLREVLEAVEEKTGTADECLFGQGSCHPGSPCPLHHVREELHQATARWADEQSLADFATRPLHPEDAAAPHAAPLPVRAAAQP